MANTADKQSDDLTSILKTLVTTIADLKQEVAAQKKEISSLTASYRKAQDINHIQANTRQVLVIGRSSGTTMEPGQLTNVLNVTGVSNSFRQGGGGNTFDFFPKLPLELRMNIWKAAMPSDRLFEPFFDPPHRAYGPGALNNITFNIGVAGGVHVPTNINNPPQVPVQPYLAQQQNAAALVAGGAPGLVAQAPVPVPRPDPPAVRFGMVYAAPKARMACREARAASAEIGGFEFGLYGTERRGYWLNHTSDIVKITTDLLAHPYFHSVDLSRIQRLAFGQGQFKSEPNAAGILELILNTCRSCREVVMLYDQDSRFTYRHPSTLTRTNIQVLKEDDIIGNHAFPPSRNLPDGPITWGELHNTVMDVWEEYMIERRLDIARIPRLNGMDLIRSSRMF